MSIPGLNRVAVVGAGPAGAFFTLELSRLCPHIVVDLYDQDGRGPGAGIVMSRDFTNRLQAVHPAAFSVPGSAMASWDRTLTVIGAERIWSGAFGMFGLRRRAFHAHVRALAAGLPNVHLIRQIVTTPPARVDLVVIADGANSRLRSARPERFGTAVSAGRTMFLWMSTPTVLQPSFFLKVLRPGPLIVHAYPHSDDESTFIVEADPATLRAHRLLDRSMSDIEKELSYQFSAELDGTPLHAQFPAWRSFPTVSNERWYDDRMVLLGDAARTVHFSTGSGTVLAIDDAMCLAGALGDARATSIPEALDRYVAERRPVSIAAQAEAEDSMLWFEQLSRRERLHGHQTVFALRSRRQANTYEKLRTRDPEFVVRAVARLTGDPAGARSDTGPGVTGSPGAQPIAAEPAGVQPPPAEPVDVPITVGGLELTGRLVRTRDGDRTGLWFPVAGGDVDCRVVDPADLAPDAGGHLPGCVLLDEPAAVRDTTAARAAGVSLLGLLVTQGRRPQAPGHPDLPLQGLDFLAVPSQPGTGRVTRTELADELRYSCGLPVLLLSAEELSRDEINTLIAAGRVDMVALVGVDELTGPPEDPEE